MSARKALGEQILVQCEDKATFRPCRGKASEPAAYPWLRMRSERSYSGLDSVAAGRTSEGWRVAGVVTGSLAFAGPLTAAVPCVREPLDAVSSAQPVPSTASMTKALRPIVRQFLFIVLSSLPSRFRKPVVVLPRELSRSAGHSDDVLKGGEVDRLGHVREEPEAEDRFGCTRFDFTTPPIFEHWPMPSHTWCQILAS